MRHRALRAQNQPVEQTLDFMQELSIGDEIMGIRKDLTGKRFGYLTVIGLDHIRKKPYGVLYKVKCDCGNIKIALGPALSYGHTRSCGCRGMSIKQKEPIGKRFGRLVVLKYAFTKDSFRFYECLCDCGNKKTTSLSSLNCGVTQSCGCLRKEKATKANTRHGLCHTKLYKSYTSMLGRCNNPKNSAYKYYGGRGIKVCARWRKSFKNFLADMGMPPFDGAQLDRKDNNKGYNPNNVEWATRRQQLNNTRRNIFIPYKGKKLTVAQWARIKNVNYSTLKNRYGRLKWSADETIALPIQARLVTNKATKK